MIKTLFPSFGPGVQTIEGIVTNVDYYGETAELVIKADKAEYAFVVIAESAPKAGEQIRCFCAVDPMNGQSMMLKGFQYVETGDLIVLQKLDMPIPGAPQSLSFAMNGLTSEGLLKGGFSPQRIMALFNESISSMARNIPSAIANMSDMLGRIQEAKAEAQRLEAELSSISPAPWELEEQIGGPLTISLPGGATAEILAGEALVPSPPGNYVGLAEPADENDWWYCLSYRAGSRRDAPEFRAELMWREHQERTGDYLIDNLMPETNSFTSVESARSAVASVRRAYEDGRRVPVLVSYDERADGPFATWFEGACADPSITKAPNGLMGDGLEVTAARAPSAGRKTYSDPMLDEDVVIMNGTILLVSNSKAPTRVTFQEDEGGLHTFELPQAYDLAEHARVRFLIYSDAEGISPAGIKNLKTGRVHAWGDDPAEFVEWMLRAADDGTGDRPTS